MIYESVFVFSGQLSSKLAEEKFQKYQDIIKSSGGEILKKESWGLRDLAYKINKNSNKIILKGDFLGDKINIILKNTNKENLRRTFEV